MSVPSHARRGFSLVEMMIATTVAVIALTGAIAFSIALQRRAGLEEQAMLAQELARAVKDLLSGPILRAGAGLGTVRLGGGQSRYALAVETNAAFAADSTFSLPSGAYAGLASDALHLAWGDSSTLVALAECGGGGTGMRNGANACTVKDGAATLLDQEVVFTNPMLKVACQHKVTHAPGDKKLQTNPGAGGNLPPSEEPCEAINAAFWSTPGAMVMQMGAAAFRVNWASGDPVLEYDPDGVVSTGSGWQAVSREVERLQVRLGVANLTDPALDLTWFPREEAGGAIPAIDQCTAAICAVPGGIDAQDTTSGDADLDARDALMRRVRVVELEITARSRRPDRDQIVQVGAGFGTDSDGNLQDGFRRRTYTVHLAPRNLGVVGAVPVAAAGGGGP